MAQAKLFLMSDTIVSLGDPRVPQGDSGLYDGLAGTPINNATVVLEEFIHVDSNTRITGFTPTVAMPYLAGSNGVYRATLDGGITDNLVEGERYRLRFRATAPGPSVGVFHLDVYAERNQAF